MAEVGEDPFSFSEASSQKHEGEEPEPDDFFTLGEFSFPGDIADAAEAKGQAQTTRPGPVVSATIPSQAAEDSELNEPSMPVSPSPDGKRGAQEATLDFSFGAKQPAAMATEISDEDELPPLSISSRRKGRSWLTVSVVAISVTAIVALTGAGLYLLQSGPAALQQFDRLGLGFVAQWFGMERPEDERVVVRNPLAAFHQNKEAGEIFVVTGDVVNSYRKPRASIHVKVSLFDKNGAVLLQKSAYCGNKLSNEQLDTLPMAKIDAIMNNQFGDSLANLGVQPGRAIGFVVAISNVPKEAADFGVEVIGSTVAAGQ